MSVSNDKVTLSLRGERKKVVVQKEDIMEPKKIEEGKTPRNLPGAQSTYSPLSMAMSPSHNLISPNYYSSSTVQNKSEIN